MSQYDEARGDSAAADRKQRTEKLEQLFAASGARLNVFRFGPVEWRKL